MTDTADTADTPDSGPVAATVATKLLALQHVDTEADQLAVRRKRLDERGDLAQRTAEMTTWERRRKQIGDRLQELTDAIEADEQANTVLGTHRTRLEAQLKTVIAPREAEALMHEIATINGRRDELDDSELAALEEQAELDDERTAHLGREEALRSALIQADDALAAACGDIDVELAGLAALREQAVADLDDKTVAHYEAVRSSMGVAVSELRGHRCGGCHLDLSAAEIDTAKDDAAESGVADCPQCGRMLVI